MNSIKFHFCPIKSPGIIAAKMWIREGSRSDPTNQRGIHYLMGSLLCRGCGPYSNEDLGDLIEGKGAGLLTETYEDGILISLKCIDEDIYKLLPILGWMIESPHLNTKHIKLERDLTIKALKRQKENPFYLAFDGWRSLAYKNGPYGHDPLGSIDDLDNIEQSSILSLSKKLITREKVLVVAGSLPKNIQTLVTGIEPFTRLNKTSRELPQYNQQKYCSLNVTPQEENLSLQFEQTSQVVIMLGKSTIPYNHKDDPLLRLLSCYLGTGMSSKLFLKLREEYGIAYEVGIYHPIREIATPFVIHASTSLDKAKFALKLIKEEWQNLIANPISLEDLSLAKAKFQGQVAHSYQTIAQRAERKAHLLGQHLDGNYDLNVMNKIKSVTVEQLRCTAQKHLQKPMLSLCGPKNVLIELSETWINYSE